MADIDLYCYEEFEEKDNKKKYNKKEGKKDDNIKCQYSRFKLWGTFNTPFSSALKDIISIPRGDNLIDNCGK